MSTVVGGDFEGFLRIRNRWVPAERVLGGGKNSPVTLGPGVVGHPDNVMAEFALAAPVPVELFAERVAAARQALQGHIGDTEFVPQAAIKFTKAWLDEARLSKEVGCMPDYDSNGQEYAYGAKDLGLYRCAGFHIHFDVSEQVPPDYAARVVDCTIGLASIAERWDNNQGFRRSLYGTAGRHRPKPYGIEYRTLSSNVLHHLVQLQDVLTPVAKALEVGNHPLMMLPQMMWGPVSEAINKQDVDTARVLWQEARSYVYA